MIYFIADTHFNHANIIKYTNRNFQDVAQMNDHIIRCWNQIVGVEDTVFHLGDFGFVSDEVGKKLLKDLNGTKILLRGNHDMARSKNKWIQLGFEDVHDKSITLHDKYLLSHYPTISEGKINLHGHTHSYTFYESPSSLCVGVEALKYFPISMEQIFNLE